MNYTPKQTANETFTCSPKDFKWADNIKVISNDELLDLLKNN